MSVHGWLQLLALVALLFGSTRVLGPYLARVYGGGTAPGDRFFLPLEKRVYGLLGVDPEREHRWQVYARSLLRFAASSSPTRRGPAISSPSREWATGSTGDA